MTAYDHYRNEEFKRLFREKSVMKNILPEDAFNEWVESMADIAKKIPIQIFI